MATHERAAFIFRRDLRLSDNTGLLTALRHSKKVVPIFIFDPQQADPTQNAYFSEHAFAFMVRSLRELHQTLRKKGARLFLCKGAHAQVVASLIKHDRIDAVYTNRDYTPFAIKRDLAIARVCAAHKVAFTGESDYPLSPIEHITTGNGTPYTVFTPFMRAAQRIPVPKVRKNQYSHYFKGTLATATVTLAAYDHYHNPRMPVQGGRREGLRLLRRNAYLANYAQTRNFPATAGTSQLSAHHKFGTISIRETYWRAQRTKQNSEAFIAELYWRDFYLHISCHFPHVFRRPFLRWGSTIAWKNNKTHFNAWCKGETGVPLVDAGMRQLNETGWMHNRVRMVAASYLTKNLLINWRWGERYFATKLVDYDPASNNGGWQWSASVGADPRPLRIFNPYTQAQKYDPKARYIKRWVPELAAVPAGKLTDATTTDFSSEADYPAPLIDQKESYHRAQKAYKAAKRAL